MPSSFDRQPPLIEPVPEGIPRPPWSVMIPTYNCAKYLRKTLESVLSQDPGADQMQIEVVDDCSTRDNPEAVVQEFGKGRVAFYRKPKNEGAISNFNTCIQRSRGHLVHILHGDDYVLPGFYAKLADTAKLYPNVAAFFVRCVIIDEDGTLDGVSDRIPQLVEPSHSPGDLLYTNDLLTPGTVVRRSFYEEQGGFLNFLIHVADWEMAVRAIRQGGGICLNEPLAAYRFFPGNDTGRLTRTAENLRDCLRLEEVFAANIHNFDLARFRGMVAARALTQQELFTKAGDKDAAFFSYKLWQELTPWPLRWGGKLRRILWSLLDTNRGAKR